MKHANSNPDFTVNHGIYGTYGMYGMYGINRKLYINEENITKRKKALLIFSDLDGTIFPTKGINISKFSEKMKEIQDSEDVQIKFIVVSGRNTGHTRGLMQVLDYNFKSEGVINPVDFSFSEQGGAFVDAKSQVEDIFVGDKKKIYLKEELKTTFENSKYAQYFMQCPLNKYNSAFVFKKNLPDGMNAEQKKAIRKEFIKFLKDQFAGKMKVNDSGAIEVTPPGVDKTNAIEYALREYRKNFNIAGVIYCGDSGNDISAIKYVSEMALGSGIKSYVFTPSNAKEEVSSEKLESWKDKLNPPAPKNIEKATKKTLEGLLELFQNKMSVKELIGEGIDTIRVKDDSEIRYNI